MKSQKTEKGETEKGDGSIYLVRGKIINRTVPFFVPFFLQPARVVAINVNYFFRISLNFLVRSGTT